MSTTDRPSGLAVVQYKTTPPPAGVDYAAGAYDAWSRPLWTSGDQVDAYGYHTSAFPQVSFDDLYRSQAWVAAVVNKLVRQIARTPLQVIRERPDGEQIPITPYSDDPGASLAALLRRPTPRKSSLNLKQWMAWPSLVFGNSLIAKFYGDGVDFPPTELIPMDWRCVTPYAQQGADAVELWMTTQVGGQRYVDGLSVCHFRWDSGGPIGVSPLQQLAISVQLEDAAQRLQVAAFRNSARPSGAIALPQGANPSPGQMAQMREDVERMHRGVDNAFKVALLAPGAQWVPMMFTMAEAEMMQTRQFNRDEVCSVYDVKPSQIGIMSEGEFGTVVETARDLFRMTLPPWFTMFEETLYAQLIEPEPLWEGLCVRFDTKSMMKGDPEALAGQIATMISTGQITLNEGRDYNDLPRIANEAYDKLIMQVVSNYAPVEGSPGQSPPTGPTPPSGAQPPITPTGDQRDNAIALRRQGMRDSDIARQLGVTTTTVRNWVVGAQNSGQL